MRDESSTSAHFGHSSPSAALPTSIKLRRAEQELQVEWQDGRESTFAAAFLRKNCPCATCRTEREKQQTALMPVLRQMPAENLRITSAKLVGQYAIQLIWSDGHDTGIFDFKTLRRWDDESSGGAADL